MSGRVLFHVQHLLGVGHLKRAEILATAMSAAGLEVTIAFGGLPAPDVLFRGAHVAELPPATIAGEDFSTLLDGVGQPVDDRWKALRRDALLDLFRRIDPDVVLIELFPFGRRQFRFELRPLLEEVHSRARRPRVACSVRDILVTGKTPGRDDETVDLVRRFFDAVLVHGDPALIPFEATFPAAAEIADLIRYTGYVAAPPPGSGDSAEGGGEVIVSAGGGAVGEPLLDTALAARPVSPLRDNVWRFLTGPNLSGPAFQRLAASADQATIIERFRADFPARLQVAALSISQAGYNTTMDILRSGVRAVVIPYETRGETEQRLRSGILAAKGLLTVVPAAELSPQSLAAAMASALAKAAPNPADFDLSGAEKTAALMCKLAQKTRVPSRT